MLVVSLINFRVKNQVLQISFKVVVGDLISFHTLRYDMKLFGSDMILFGFDTILFGSDMVSFGSISNFQEPLVILVAGLINFGVASQVPQVSFKLVVGDLTLVFYYEFDDIIFCESLFIYEAISYYGAQAFFIHYPMASLPIYLITCSSHHRTSKDGDILHSHRHSGS